MAVAEAIDDLIVRRVQAEYLEMPGLRLSPTQAQRLLGLDRQTCEKLLFELTVAQFLVQTRDGSFVLSSSRT